ncbi:MAG TPA: universal stress protein [Caulobacteraceae bacterium]|jgi:nucleotide-binding universal stress UspA family protein|nr:universal stress protein [Caulobacteraceae bacterium]
MSYKTILVHAGVDSDADSRLQAAFALGERFGATIVGVGAFAWDPYVDPTLGYADGETIMALRGLVDSDIAAAEAKFKRAAKDYKHPIVWRGLVDYPAKAMNALACGADLIIASRVPAKTDDRRFASPTDLIMGSGLPVLLFPAGHSQIRGGKVLVGWKNTRETRRAVSDALPLLQAADHVHLVQVAEHDAVGGQAQAGLDDLVERLARHQVFAEASIAPQIGESVVDDLMDVARSRECGLVVLGAYGHSRLREWALGGVTAYLLDAGDRPILFSR